MGDIWVLELADKLLSCIQCWGAIKSRRPWLDTAWWPTTFRVADIKTNILYRSHALLMLEIEKQLYISRSRICWVEGMSASINYLTLKCLQRFCTEAGLLFFMIFFRFVWLIISLWGVDYFGCTKAITKIAKSTFGFCSNAKLSLFPCNFSLSRFRKQGETNAYNSIAAPKTSSYFTLFLLIIWSIGFKFLVGFTANYSTQKLYRLVIVLSICLLD